MSGLDKLRKSAADAPLRGPASVLKMIDDAAAGRVPQREADPPMSDEFLAERAKWEAELREMPLDDLWWVSHRGDCKFDRDIATDELERRGQKPQWLTPGELWAKIDEVYDPEAAAVAAAKARGALS